MAKQNFIAGGFYGKLGETVGQRWKNKRTMRVYVVPKDPRTPEQVAFRSKFKSSVPLAQFAMRLNKGAPCWDNENMTEWQFRMSTAKLRVDAGVQYPLTVPLYPNGYTPAISIDGLSIVAQSSTSYRVISDSGYMFPTDRELILVVQARNTAKDVVEEVVVYAKGYADGGFLMSFDLPTGYTVAPDALIYGVSTDDREHENEMIAIPLQGVSQANVVIVDDWSYSYDSDGSIILQSDLLSTIQSAHTLNLSLSMRNMVTGELDGVTQEVSVIAGADTITLPPSLAKYVLWSDTYIAGTDITQADTTEKVIIPQMQLGTETKKTVTQSALGFPASYLAEVHNDWYDAQISLSAQFVGSLFEGKFMADTLELDYTYANTPTTGNATVDLITDTGTGSDVIAEIKATLADVSLDDVQSFVRVSGCKLVNDWAEVELTADAVDFNPTYDEPVQITDWQYGYTDTYVLRIYSAKIAKIKTQFSIPISYTTSRINNATDRTDQATITNQTMHDDQWQSLSAAGVIWWNGSKIEIPNAVDVRPNIRILASTFTLSGITQIERTLQAQQPTLSSSGLWFEGEENANFALKVRPFGDVPDDFSWDLAGVTITLNIQLSNGAYNQTLDLADVIGDISAGTDLGQTMFVITGKIYIPGADDVAGSNGTWSMSAGFTVYDERLKVTLTAVENFVLTPQEQ